MSEITTLITTVESFGHQLVHTVSWALLGVCTLSWLAAFYGTRSRIR